MAAWGALAVAAVSAYSAYKSSQQGKEAMEISQDEMQFAREQWERRMEMAEAALERELMNAQYMFDWNDQRLGMAEEYMNYSRGWAERDRALRDSDAAFAEYRISEQDRLEAAERMRQLQQDLEGRAMAKEERERALQELEYVKQIAQGERAYDERRFREDRATQRREYEQRAGAYRDMQRQLAEERAYEVGRSEEILTGARRMGRELDRAMGSMGEMQPMKEYGEEDVLGLEAQYARDYMKDAERAADRMASQTQGSLIRAGMDASTTGEGARRETLQDYILPTMAKARQAARAEAMQRINSLQGMEQMKARQEMAQREQTLAEVVSAMNPHLQALAAAPMPESAATPAWGQLGTGILNRDLSSANRFQAPINVGQGWLSPGSYGIGMSNAVANPVSRFGTQPSEYNMAGLNLWDPVAGMTGPSSFLGGGYNANPAAWANLSNQAWGNAGSSAKTATTQFGSFWDSLGSSGAGGTS